MCIGNLEMSQMKSICPHGQHKEQKVCEGNTTASYIKPYKDILHNFGNVILYLIYDWPNENTTIHLCILEQ